MIDTRNPMELPQTFYNARFIQTLPYRLIDFINLWSKRLFAMIRLLIKAREKSSVKIKENIPAMFPQGSEWGASQLMQENMVLALYASASTNDPSIKGNYTS